MDKSLLEDFHIWQRGGRLAAALVLRSAEVVRSMINSQDLKWKSTDSENAEIGMLKSTDSENAEIGTVRAAKKLIKTPHRYIN